MSITGMYNNLMKCKDILRRAISSNAATRDKALAEAAKHLGDMDKAEKEYAESKRAEQSRRERRAKAGRKASGKFEIAPACEGGCDHGATGIVLMRKGKLRLVWRSGSKYFGGIGMQSYAPADLEILGAETLSIKVTNSHTRSLRGEKTRACRLSKALVLMNADQIDATFGEGSAKKAAELKGTVVL